MTGSKSTTLKVGDYVRHLSSWAGTVIAIDEENDGGMGQGPLTTVRPTHPRPKTYLHGTPVGDEWEGWNPITVGADELEVVERG